MAAKKLGKEARKIASIRIEPRTLEKIKRAYGSLTNFVNLKIKNDRKIKGE